MRHTQTARELALVLLLRAQGRMPAKVLADALQVSERTIDRDNKALYWAGIAVVSQHGPGGGMSLEARVQVTLDHAWLLEHYIPGTRAKDAHRARMPSAATTRAAAVPWLVRVRRAVHTIQAALPEEYRAGFAVELEQLDLRLRAVESGPAELPFLVDVRKAIWLQRRMRIDYPTSGGGSQACEIDPYILLMARDSWHVTAYCHEREAVEAFTVALILAAEILETAVDAPPTILHPRPDV